MSSSESVEADLRGHVVTSDEKRAVYKTPDLGPVVKSVDDPKKIFEYQRMQFGLLPRK